MFYNIHIVDNSSYNPHHRAGGCILVPLLSKSVKTNVTLCLFLLLFAPQNEEKKVVWERRTCRRSIQMISRASIAPSDSVAILAQALKNGWAGMLVLRYPPSLERRAAAEYFVAAR